MAYFEIAYAWMRVQLKTVFGNFLKEVFHRVGVMLLLVAIYFGVIDFHQLMWGVFWVYALRMLFDVCFRFFMYTDLPLLGDCHRVRRKSFCTVCL